MAKRKNIVTIHRASRQWSRLRGLAPKLEKAAMVTLQHLPKALRLRMRVSLLLTTDANMRALNRDFRGKDKATNVLSFPQYEPIDLSNLKHEKAHIEIGDIALAYQYIVYESKKEHKILINHVTHLFIHGLLHLFGYDHRTDPEADKMERLETKIMAALDLPDPYAPAKTMEPKRKRKVALHRSRRLHPKK